MLHRTVSGSSHEKLEFILNSDPGDRFYLACSENCFSEGNLIFDNNHGKFTCSITVPAGRFSYYIMRNQYDRVDEEGTKISRRRTVRIALSSPDHGTDGKRYAYSTGNMAQIVLLHPAGKEIDLEKNDGSEVLKKRVVDLGYGLATVFYTRNTNSYSFTDEPSRTFEIIPGELPHEHGSGLMYHIFPDRFCAYPSPIQVRGIVPVEWSKRPSRFDFHGGNIMGIISKLDYLQEMNVEYIYLNPLFVSSSNHRYDVEDYFSIDPMLGTKEDLVRLVQEAHRRHMKVILDMVFNHTSSNHPMFRDLLESGKNSKFHDWYVFHGDDFKAYNGVYDLKRHMGAKPPYETFMGVGKLPKLNHLNPKVREFLRDVLLYHVKTFDVDGFRYDVGHSIPSGTVEYLKQECSKTKGGLIHIGEALCLAGSFIDRGYYDSLTNYHIGKAIRDYVAGQISVTDFYREYVKEIIAYGNALSRMMNVLDSHDTVRILTSLRNDKARLKLAYLLLFMLNGISTIYYGDEVGLLGNGDPDCRRSFPWDQISNELHNYFVTISRLRTERTSFRSGLLTVYETGKYDAVAKIGERRSLFLYVGKKGTAYKWDTSNHLEELLSEAELIMEEPKFTLFEVDTEALSRFDGEFLV